VSFRRDHKSGQVRGVAAVYNRYSYSTEKREVRGLGFVGVIVLANTGRLLFRREAALSLRLTGCRALPTARACR
jgi:hypothetical protein